MTAVLRTDVQSRLCVHSRGRIHIIRLGNRQVVIDLPAKGAGFSFLRVLADFLGNFDMSECIRCIKSPTAPWQPFYPLCRKWMSNDGFAAERIAFTPLTQATLSVLSQTLIRMIVT